LHYFFENSLAIFWKIKRELPFSLIRVIITKKPLLGFSNV